MGASRPRSASTRREFLARIARGSLVLGLASCGGDPLEILQPKILKKALGAMRADGKPGIVVRIPNDPDIRLSLGTVLAEIGGIRSLTVKHPDHDPWETRFDAHELFTEAVFVCLEEAEIL